MERLLSLLLAACVLIVTELQLHECTTTSPEPLECSGLRDVTSFQHGKSYSYAFNITHVLKARGHTNAPVNHHMEGVATIHAGPYCQHEIILSNVTIRAMEFTEKGRSMQELTELERMLEAYSHPFTYDNGVLGSVCRVSKDDLFASNVKNAILAQLQVKVNRYGAPMYTTEWDASDFCLVEYRPVNVTEDYITVSKRKPLGGCKRKLNEMPSFNPESDKKPAELRKSAFIDGEQNCEIKFQRGGHVISSSCKEVWTVEGDVSNNGRGLSDVEVQTKLTFTGTGTATVLNPLCIKSSTENIEEAANVLGINAEEGDILTTLRKIEQHADASLFLRLINQLKPMDLESLSSTHKSVGKKGKQMIEDSLPFVASTAAVKFMLELVNTRENDVEHMEWVAKLADLQNPTTDQISAIQATLLDMDFQTAAFVSSTLIKRRCHQLDGCLLDPSVSPLIEEIETKLGDGCMKSSRVETLIALRAIGNMAQVSNPPKMIPVLGRCLMNRDLDIQVRAYTAEAFREFPPSPAHCDLLWESFASKTEDTEVRVQAYRSFVNCLDGPNLEALLNLLQTQHSQQVGSFVTSHLLALFRSRNPKDQVFKPIILPQINWLNQLAHVFDLSRSAYSRYYDEKQDELGLNAAVVFGPQSLLPRFVEVGVDVHLFGARLNLLQVGYRSVENSYLTRMLLKVKRTVMPDHPVNTTDEISRMDKMMDKKVKANKDTSLYYRISGEEKAFIPNVEGAFVRHLTSIIMNPSFNKRIRSQLYDFDVPVRTIGGMVLRIRLQSAAIGEGNVTIDFANTMRFQSTINLSGEVKAEVVIQGGNWTGGYIITDTAAGKVAGDISFTESKTRTDHNIRFILGSADTPHKLISYSRKTFIIGKETLVEINRPGLNVVEMKTPRSLEQLAGLAISANTDCWPYSDNSGACSRFDVSLDRQDGFDLAVDFGRDGGLIDGFRKILIEVQRPSTPSRTRSAQTLLRLLFETNSIDDPNLWVVAALETVRGKHFDVNATVSPSKGLTGSASFADFNTSLNGKFNFEDDIKSLQLNASVYDAGSLNLLTLIQSENTYIVEINSTIRQWPFALALKSKNNPLGMEYTLGMNTPHVGNVTLRFVVLFGQELDLLFNWTKNGKEIVYSTYWNVNKRALLHPKWNITGNSSYLIGHSEFIQNGQTEHIMEARATIFHELQPPYRYIALDGNLRFSNDSSKTISGSTTVTAYVQRQNSLNVSVDFDASVKIPQLNVDDDINVDVLFNYHNRSRQLLNVILLRRFAGSEKPFEFIVTAQSKEDFITLELQSQVDSTWKYKLSNELNMRQRRNIFLLRSWDRAVVNLTSDYIIAIRPPFLLRIKNQLQVNEQNYARGDTSLSFNSDPLYFLVNLTAYQWKYNSWDLMADVEIGSRIAALNSLIDFDIATNTSITVPYLPIYIDVQQAINLRWSLEAYYFGFTGMVFDKISIQKYGVSAGGRSATVDKGIVENSAFVETYWSGDPESPTRLNIGCSHKLWEYFRASLSGRLPDHGQVVTTISITRRNVAVTDGSFMLSMKYAKPMGDVKGTYYKLNSKLVTDKKELSLIQVGEYNEHTGEGPGMPFRYGVVHLRDVHNNGGQIKLFIEHEYLRIVNNVDFFDSIIAYEVREDIKSDRWILDVKVMATWRFKLGRGVIGAHGGLVAVMSKDFQTMHCKFSGIMDTKKQTSVLALLNYEMHASPRYIDCKLEAAGAKYIDVSLLAISKGEHSNFTATVLIPSVPLAYQMSVNGSQLSEVNKIYSVSGKFSSQVGSNWNYHANVEATTQALFTNDTLRFRVTPSWKSDIPFLENGNMEFALTTHNGSSIDLHFSHMQNEKLRVTAKIAAQPLLVDLKIANKLLSFPIDMNSQLRVDFWTLKPVNIRFTCNANLPKHGVALKKLEVKYFFDVTSKELKLKHSLDLQSNHTAIVSISVEDMINLKLTTTPQFNQQINSNWKMDGRTLHVIRFSVDPAKECLFYVKLWPRLTNMSNEFYIQSTVPLVNMRVDNFGFIANVQLEPLGFNFSSVLQYSNVLTNSNRTEPKRPLNDFLLHFMHKGASSKRSVLFLNWTIDRNPRGHYYESNTQIEVNLGPLHVYPTTFRVKGEREQMKGLLDIAKLGRYQILTKRKLNGETIYNSLYITRLSSNGKYLFTQLNASMRITPGSNLFVRLSIDDDIYTKVFVSLTPNTTAKRTLSLVAWAAHMESKLLLTNSTIEYRRLGEADDGVAWTVVSVFYTNITEEHTCVLNINTQVEKAETGFLTSTEAKFVSSPHLDVPGIGKIETMKISNDLRLLHSQVHSSLSIFYNKPILQNNITINLLEESYFDANFQLSCPRMQNTSAWLKHHKSEMEAGVQVLRSLNAHISHRYADNQSTVMYEDSSNGTFTLSSNMLQLINGFAKSNKTLEEYIPRGAKYFLDVNGYLVNVSRTKMPVQGAIEYSVGLRIPNLQEPQCVRLGWLWKLPLGPHANSESSFIELAELTGGSSITLAADVNYTDDSINRLKISGFIRLPDLDDARGAEVEILRDPPIQMGTIKLELYGTNRVTASIDLIPEDDFYEYRHWLSVKENGKYENEVWSTRGRCNLRRLWSIPCEITYKSSIRDSRFGLRNTSDFLEVEASWNKLINGSYILRYMQLPNGGKLQLEGPSRLLTGIVNKMTLQRQWLVSIISEDRLQDGGARTSNLTALVFNTKTTRKDYKLHELGMELQSTFLKPDGLYFGIYRETSQRNETLNVMLKHGSKDDRQASFAEANWVLNYLNLSSFTLSTFVKVRKQYFEISGPFHLEEKRQAADLSLLLDKKEYQLQFRHIPYNTFMLLVKDHFTLHYTTERLHNGLNVELILKSNDKRIYLAGNAGIRLNPVSLNFNFSTTQGDAIGVTVVRPNSFAFDMYHLPINGSYVLDSSLSQILTADGMVKIAAFHNPLWMQMLFTRGLPSIVTGDFRNFPKASSMYLLKVVNLFSMDFVNALTSLIDEKNLHPFVETFIGDTAVMVTRFNSFKKEHLQLAGHIEEVGATFFTEAYKFSKKCCTNITKARLHQIYQKATWPLVKYLENIDRMSVKFAAGLDFRNLTPQLKWALGSAKSIFGEGSKFISQAEPFVGTIIRRYVNAMTIFANRILSLFVGQDRLPIFHFASKFKEMLDELYQLDKPFGKLYADIKDFASHINDVISQGVKMGTKIAMRISRYNTSPNEEAAIKSFVAGNLSQAVLQYLRFNESNLDVDWNMMSLQSTFYLPFNLRDTFEYISIYKMKLKKGLKAAIKYIQSSGGMMTTAGVFQAAYSHLKREQYSINDLPTNQAWLLLGDNVGDYVVTFDGHTSFIPRSPTVTYLLIRDKAKRLAITLHYADAACYIRIYVDKLVLELRNSTLTLSQSSLNRTQKFGSPWFIDQSPGTEILQSRQVTSLNFGQKRYKFAQLTVMYYHRNRQLQIIASPAWHGDLTGLMGTNDYERTTDQLTPQGNEVFDLDSLASLWVISGSQTPRKVQIPSRQRASRNQKYTEFLRFAEHDEKPLNIQPFGQVLRYNVQFHNDSMTGGRQLKSEDFVCDLYRAYSQASYDYGVALRVPNRCISCGAPDQQGGITVIFIIKLDESIRRHKREIIQLARNLKQQLGTERLQFSALVLGGSGAFQEPKWLFDSADNIASSFDQFQERLTEFLQRSDVMPGNSIQSANLSAALPKLHAMISRRGYNVIPIFASPYACGFLNEVEYETIATSLKNNHHSFYILRNPYVQLPIGACNFFSPEAKGHRITVRFEEDESTKPSEVGQPLNVVKCVCLDDGYGRGEHRCYSKKLSTAVLEVD